MFENVPLSNQRVWDAHPERVHKNALDAIAEGGFYDDCIKRRTGNYEGQIMAIRNGWLDKSEDGFVYDRWITNEKGWAAYEDAGRQRPVFLKCQDTWHDLEFEYIVKTTTKDDEPALQLFKESYPAKGNTGKEPVLTRKNVVQLRDFLNDWLEKS